MFPFFFSITWYWRNQTSSSSLWGMCKCKIGSLWMSSSTPAFCKSIFNFFRNCAKKFQIFFFVSYLVWMNVMSVVFVTPPLSRETIYKTTLFFKQKSSTIKKQFEIFRIFSIFLQWNDPKNKTICRDHDCNHDQSNRPFDNTNNF